MNIAIRTVLEEDAASIAALLNTIIQTGIYTVMDTEIPVDEQLDFIRRFPRRGVFHVAVYRTTGEVVGLQDVMPLLPGAPAFRHVGEISTFVAPAFHRNGIGRNLTRETFRQAQQQGFLKLSATVRADNPHAVAFYLRQGFRVIGTALHHAFVRGRYVDEILMEQWIGTE